MRLKDTACGSYIGMGRRCGVDGEQCDRCGRIDILRAENEVLRVEIDLLTADRDRYKAWHDAVMARPIRAYDDNNQRLIVRPQPLKENE